MYFLLEGIFSTFLQQDLDKEPLLKGSSWNSSISFARPFPTQLHHTPQASSLVILFGHLRLFYSFWTWHFHASEPYLCCFLYLESPFLLNFYLGKFLITPRSRSHASTSVKSSLHIYYTFLWDFSSQIWLCTLFCSAVHVLM